MKSIHRSIFYLLQISSYKNLIILFYFSCIFLIILPGVSYFQLMNFLCFTHIAVSKIFYISFTRSGLFEYFKLFTFPEFFISQIGKSQILHNNIYRNIVLVMFVFWLHFYVFYFVLPSPNKLFFCCFGNSQYCLIMSLCQAYEMFWVPLRLYLQGFLTQSAPM